MSEISRRSFLRGLIGRGASAFAESLGADGDETPEPPPFARPVSMGREHEPLEGIPLVHPWIAVAHAAAERLGRRIPFILLLGASGEAFRIVYQRDAARIPRSPVNTFLAALAVTGLSARAAGDGPFSAALAEAGGSMGRDSVVVIATDRGPAMLMDVDEEAGAIECLSPRDGAGQPTFEELAEGWPRAAWVGGPAPFLRIMIEAGEKPRSLDEVTRAGLETMLLLLTRDFATAAATGLDAYEAWARDLREGTLTIRALEVQHEELLLLPGIGRAAAARFLSSIARAVPPDVRGEIEAAAGSYEKIHRLSPTGEAWGTGLYPDLAECLLTDDLPDPGLYEDPAIRSRAADLILEIRAREAEAVERIRSLPKEWRTV